MMIDRPPKQIGVRELRDRLTAVVEEVKQGEPHVVLNNNWRMAVMIKYEEGWWWERVEWALAALHGLEVYPELARGTSELALIVRGQRRFSQRDLEGLARERRDILGPVHTVGTSEARLHMADILEAVARGKKWILLSGGRFAVTMIRPKEYERLQRLHRIVTWFRTAGLELAESTEDEIAKWVREFRSVPAADAADEGSAIA